MINGVILQVVTSTLDTVSTMPAVPDKISFFALIMKGGPIMIPIGLLPLITIYIWIYKFLSIRNAARIDERFLPHIKDHLYSGNLQSAQSFSSSTPTALGRIIENGVSNIGRPVKDIESSLETASNIELSEMEKNLGYLGIIAGVAPMLGFIGTIAGIIRIFYDISVSEDISIGVISAGLYEKMITSGCGLIVGIIAYTAYHILNIKIDRFTLRLQKNTFEFIKLLNKPTNENKTR